MTEEPKILNDYSITAFLCEETWKVKYQVHSFEDPHFKRPIFDTFDEAKKCVALLRFYPISYVSDEYGKWNGVEK